MLTEPASAALPPGRSQFPATRTWCPRPLEQHPSHQQRGDLGPRGHRQPRLHRRQLLVPAEHDGQPRHGEPAVARRLQPQHRTDRHDVPPGDRRRGSRPSRRRRRHQALHRGHLQDDQWRREEERGLCQPLHRRSRRGFTANASSQVDSLAATNTTVYVGGRFKINTTPMVGLAAVDGVTGAVDTAFDNQLSGGIGVDGTLSARELKLTHDNSKLLVVHTARRIDGQDRYGVGLIDTQTKQLLPWRTRLWEDNLPFIGGIHGSTRVTSPPTTRTSWSPARTVATGHPSATPQSPSPSTAGTTCSRAGSTAPSTASTPWPSPSGPCTSAATSLERVAHGTRSVAGAGQRRLRQRPGPVGVRAR